MIRIINTEPLDYSEEAKGILQQFAEYSDEDISIFGSEERLQRVDVMIVRLGAKISREVIDKAPHLKIISSATTGLDHIDMDEAHRRGIKILSLRGEEAFLDTIPSTADLTFGLLLALLRNIPQSFNNVLEGLWDRDRFRGHQLKGKNIGIIGLGRIGRKMASYAAAFDMNVGFFDVKPVEGGRCRKFDSLEDLLGWADIISVHVHLTEENRLLLSEKNLPLMKKGSWFLNTSRGGIVDENVLACMIRNGHLKGIAVDVLSSELDREIVSNPLWKLAKEGYNIIITPHTGGASYEAMHDCEIFMAKKLKCYLEEAGLI